MSRTYIYIHNSTKTYDITILQKIAIKSLLNEPNEKDSFSTIYLKPKLSSKLINFYVIEGHWKKDENERFKLGYAMLGKQWTRISKEFVKTRDRDQVISHAQKILPKKNKKYFL
jgi:hypothetical protein